MELIDKAFSFLGNKDDADSEFGKLSRYCITEEEAMSEKHELKLITADFDKDKGYLWFVYNQDAFDGKNQKIRGSRDILVRITLANTNREWVVIYAKEHP